MEKLFAKREPTNEFKFILKKKLNFTRMDKYKPMYLDDLKRVQKLKEISGKVYRVEKFDEANFAKHISKED
jgi:hypothetical protein